MMIDFVDKVEKCGLSGKVGGEFVVVVIMVFKECWWMDINLEGYG